MSWQTDLDQILEDARVVMQLRTRTERRSLGEAPAQDIIARVHACLSVADLSRDTLLDVRQGGDHALRSEGESESIYRIQSMAVSLKDVSLGGLGAFLAAWKQSSPAWRVTRISLTHPRAPASGSRRSGEADQFDVQIVVTTHYLEG